MNYARMSADFDGRHPEIWRYSLERWLNDVGARTVLFCGLNPSTATHEVDDPTIRREVGFTQAWGFDRYVKVNVYAKRSTDPKALYTCAHDPVGPRNLRTLKTLMDRAELIVAAWGANKLHPAAIEIAEMILADPRTKCLGLTKQGAPKHPLYLKKDSALVTIPPGKGYIAL